MKILKILSAIALSTILFTGCEKDEEFIKHEKSSFTKDKSHNTKSIMPNITMGSNNLLEFESFSDIQDYTNAIETQIEDHYLSFIEPYLDLEEDSIIYYMESLGFNEDLPIENFESQFSSFVSLRMSINDEMSSILEQDDFEWTETPDAHFVQDDVDRAFLNEDAAVKVGDTTYFLIDSGWVAAGPEASYTDVLDDIKNGGSLVGPYRDVVVVILPCLNCSGGGGGSCVCKTNIQGTESATSSDKKLIGVLSLYTYPWAAKLVVKAKGYHKTLLLGWLPKRSQCVARINSGTELRDISCGAPNVLPQMSDISYGWQAKETVVSWGTTVKAKCNKVSGYASSVGLGRSLSIW